MVAARGTEGGQQNWSRSTDGGLSKSLNRYSLLLYLLGPAALIGGAVLLHGLEEGLTRMIRIGAVISLVSLGLFMRFTPVLPLEPIASRSGEEKPKTLWQAMGASEKIAFLLCIGSIMGALGPWTEVGDDILYGAQADGWLIAGPGILALYFLGRSHLPNLRVSTGLFGFMFLLSVSKIWWPYPIRVAGEAILLGSMHWGLPLALLTTLLGGVVIYRAWTGSSNGPDDVLET